MANNYNPRLAGHKSVTRGSSLPNFNSLSCLTHRPKASTPERKINQRANNPKGGGPTPIPAPPGDTLFQSASGFHRKFGNPATWAPARATGSRSRQRLPSQRHATFHLFDLFRLDGRHPVVSSECGVGPPRAPLKWPATFASTVQYVKSQTMA